MNIVSMANEAGFIRQRSLLHWPSRLVAFLRQYFHRFLSPIFFYTFKAYYSPLFWRGVGGEAFSLFWRGGGGEAP